MKPLKIIAGVILVIMGLIVLEGALFMEETQVGDESVGRILRTVLAFGFFGTAYYFCFKKKELTTKTI